MNPCQQEDLQNLNGFHALGSRWHKANDSSWTFLLEPVLVGKTTTNEGKVFIRFLLNSIDLNHYQGPHPWGLPQKITVQDLVKTFGTQYVVVNEHRELLFPENVNPFTVQLNPDDKAIYVDFYKKDDDAYFDEVRLRSKYEASGWLKPGMRLEDLPREYGCMRCSHNNGCEEGNDCGFRFANGEVQRIEMKEVATSLHYESAIYLNNMYKVGYSMKNFTFGSKTMEANFNALEAYDPKHSSNMTKIAINYNQKVNRCP